MMNNQVMLAIIIMHGVSELNPGMELTATLIFLFLPLVASDRLLPDDDKHTSRRSNMLNLGQEEENRIGHQQQRSGGGSKSMKVIDVSADNDQKADSNGEFTSAT